MKNKRIFQCSILAALICILTLSGVLLYQNWKLDDLQQSMLKELDSGEDRYDPQSIVLRDTSKAEAEELAELLGAQLRITQDGSFAVLYLPEEMTIRDVVAEDENREILSQLSIDYQVQVSELSAENEETGLRLPARPDHTVSDDSYGQQHYLDYLNMGNVWASYTGSGVSIAVIDTGIDTDHPEFAGRISEYSYNATEDKIVKDYQTDWSLIEDEQGHGTAVTGVLAAAMDNDGIVGIAPDVEIIVIKAECDENGNFKRSSDLVFALYYAIERDVQVVNMSFGVGQNVFAEAIQLAYDSDVICVASAGNESTAALTYPAADPLVIGVGALESDGWNLAEYSNYGENVDIVAPGTTYTAAMGGGYETKHGTSMSAPQVAGAIALFMQNNRYATFDKVTEVLYASGYDLGDLGRDWYYGFGGLDLHAFLLEERGTVTFEMLTDELENEDGLFIRNHTMQELPEPERLYAVFDGWYYDDMFTEEYNYYSDVFTGDLTLYAKWVNEDDGIPYTYVVLDDGTVEIRSYTGHRRFITVPEKIDGRVVSSIGDFAFSGQTRLREVTLPSGLTNIGLSAFAGCSNLVTMHIPANVTQLGNYAFADNVRLSTLSFAGNELTTIGKFAFSGCCRLEQIELPSSVNSVDGSAFYGTTGMQRMTVRSGNTVFASQDGVLFTADGSKIVAYPAGRDGEYSLPGTCTEIGDYAFACSGLGTIDLKSVSTMGMSAFEHAALETLTIPDGVTSIGSGAFAFNVKLAQVQLGNGLTQISGEMFKGCSALQDIHIPAGIQSIEGMAFGFSSLKTVTFVSNSELETIGKDAFYCCTIETISVPDSVKTIGASAFYLNPLTSVTLSGESQLKNIGMEAFRYCWLLTGIDLPGKLEIIDELAFANTGLNTVAVPASVTTLGEGAFAYCNDLTGVTVEADNSAYQDISGVVYSSDNTLIHTYPAGKTEDTYTLEAETTSIGSYAFAGTSHLTTVYLSDVLVDINEYGFDCSGIDHITIPDSVIRLGRFSFTNCSDLTMVSFNATSNLARIGYSTFVNCGLTGFTVPANVSTMGQKVFVDCDALTAVTFAADSKLESLSAYIFKGCENLRSITFLPGSALTSVQAHGLEGMANLTSIDFGDARVTNIDNFAFRFCTGLSSLELPKTVTNVGRYAFYGCESLSELTLPENVEHIGSYAFLGTTDLQLYLSADHVPEYLDEDWDRGIAGYYVGVTDVNTSGDYKYATLTSGGVAVLEYLGSEESVDLTAVELGAPITAIGGKAFQDSTITSVTLPDSLTEIQAEAFAYTGLTDVTIPANVTFIGREAFVGTDIATLDFASGSELKTIEQRAFADTENLTSVVIPDSVTKLGTGVFQSSGLKNVIFADGIQLAEIPQRAFMGTKLESVALPDSVTLVNHNAFNGVETLKNVTFGNNDGIRLMSNAFYRTGLTSLDIPANVTYIGEFSFVGLENLKDFTVDAENPNYTAEDGLLLSKSGRKLIAVPAGRTGSLTVPTSVEEIGFGAFERSALSKLNFDAGANILTVGCRAFFEAENLTTITIPASVVSVDYYAFAYCENLQTVEFAEGNQLKGIYEGAFCGDRNLTNITVPGTIVELSDFAFYGCEKLDQIPMEDTSALKGIYDYAFAYTGISGDFTTPENLIDIGNYAFTGIKAEKITVPDTKQKELIIGLGAFEGCNQLTEITLPFIGASFDDMEISWLGYIFGAGSYEANETYVPQSLKTVTITEGITTIGIGGFAYCTGLETINLPDGIKELYNDAFVNTTARYELTSPIATYVGNGDGRKLVARRAHFGRGIAGKVEFVEGVVIEQPDIMFSNCVNLSEIVLPEGLTSIGASMFQEAASLKKVSIPQSVTEIESGAFAYCYSLTELTVTEGVTSIGRMAFQYTPLMRIVLPSTLVSIDEAAFLGCANLYEIYNNSALELSFGSTDHGRIAACAKVIIDAEGNRIYRDGETEFEYIDTADGFRFIREDATYKLVAYIGDEETVRLPLLINGCEYTLDHFCGAATVIVPGEFSTIDTRAFAGASVKKLVLEEGIERIDNYAFSGSTMQEIDLPDTLTYIGSGAFFDCEELKYIDIPDSVTYIGDSAWNCCLSLKTVHLPRGITELRTGTFTKCWSLVFIAIPDSVTTIGNSVFQQCVNLEHVKMSSNVTSIGGNAFTECNSLKSVAISDTVVSIGENAFPSNADVTFIAENDHFRYIDGILYDAEVKTILHVSASLPTNLVLPETVTSIPRYVFQNNTSIRNIVIPEGITRLETGAFEGSSLESIHLPDSMEYIGENAFRGCKNLRSINIPEGVAWIGSSAFSDCISLTKIEIPDGITRIFTYTFLRTGLVSICIPDTVTQIDYMAFGECESLHSVYLPDGLITIGESAFKKSTNLVQITLPGSLASIGNKAFEGCEELKYIDNRSSLELSFGSSEHGMVACYAKVIVDASGEKRYLNETTDYEIIDTGDGFRFVREDGSYRLVAYIGDRETVTLPDTINGHSYMLWYFSGGKTIIVPDGFEEIHENAFRNNSVVETIVIPETVETIGACAFSNCCRMTGIEIPDSVETIEERAFSGCKMLVSVRLPKGLTEISNGLFSGCSSLLGVAIPDAVTSISGGTFSKCDSLNELTIPDSVRYIGSYPAYNSGLYNNSEYWINGMLIVDGWLLDVADDLEYLSNLDQISNVAADAYSGCHNLKNAVLGCADLSLSNMRTLIIPAVHEYSKWITSTMTLENIVIPDSFDTADLHKRPSLFRSINNVTIFVEGEEKDLRWDANFPGWNNGNKVIYGNNWIWVNFYDDDGTLLLSEPKRTSEVIRRPFVDKQDECYTYELIGWDLDGDGAADVVPATSATDINAVAVYQRTPKMFTITFKDAQSGEIYSQQKLAYGATITPPADPVKEGCIFEGWSGYSEGMTVSGNIEFTAKWHMHDYQSVVTEPTCTEQGYTTHTCHCGDSYMDSYVDALNHSFTDYASDSNATCTEDGTKTAECDHCDVTDTIPDVGSALGHDMGSWETTVPATCTEKGGERRNCSRCDHTENREIEAVGHSWDKGVVTREPTENIEGELLYTCTACGATKTESIPVIGHEHSYEAVVTAPTCTEQGYTTYTCKCGESYIADYEAALGHNFGEWVVITEPTTTEDGLEERSCTRCGHTEQRTVAKMENPFNDVAPGSFYYEPVMWAIENGITNGTSAITFGPNDQCMRAHVVTFLWRAVGSPEPTKTDNPFVDVKSTDFYYKPVLWAVENGITSGMDATHFGPTAYCNRAQVVTFLYRTVGSPAVDSSQNPFTDVPAGQWFTAPVLWAVENGITNGLSATTFGPNTICNRAQIVTFLYRAFVD